MAQPTSFTDNNKNGYPDAFEAEEAALLDKINARRKQYMDRMNRAEDQYAQQNQIPGDKNLYNAAKAKTENDSIRRLFG